VKINTKHADILSEDLSASQHTYQGQLAKFVGMADKRIFRIISAGKYEAQTPLMFKISFKLSLVIYPVINQITSCSIYSSRPSLATRCLMFFSIFDDGVCISNICGVNGRGLCTKKNELGFGRDRG